MKCKCGHDKSQHIYEEGACRPGFVCKCEQFGIDMSTRTFTLEQVCEAMGKSGVTKWCRDDVKAALLAAKPEAKTCEPWCWVEGQPGVPDGWRIVRRSGPGVPWHNGMWTDVVACVGEEPGPSRINIPLNASKETRERFQRLWDDRKYVVVEPIVPAEPMDGGKCKYCCWWQAEPIAPPAPGNHPGTPSQEALTVDCPECGAKAGQPCKVPKLSPIDRYHIPRFEAAREAPGKPDEAPKTCFCAGDYVCPVHEAARDGNQPDEAPSLPGEYVAGLQSRLARRDARIAELERKIFRALGCLSEELK